jgi:hypothetical protein
VKHALGNVRAPASGFVSLWAVVTDVKGDRSVEIILRAFAVN